MSALFRFRPRVFPLETAPSTERLIDALGGRRGACLLDSAGGAPQRFSLLGFDPLARAGPAPRSLNELRKLCAELEAVDGDAPPGPFAGGFLGALSYDLGVAGEALDLPADPWGTPPIVGGLYTDFVVVDHVAARAWLVLGEEPGDGRATVAERRARVEAELGDARPPDAPRASGPLVRHVAAAEHSTRIERARAWIAAGEIYQANLAHRFTRAVSGAPHALYRRLRQVNPAPWMGYLAWGPQDAPEGALLSASPELLVECDGRMLRTRPIKGTIARAQDPALDAARRAELCASEKDRAELAMIVDLERNDLGRVARTGSVRVEDFAQLESYAAVHHLVADVHAELAPGLDAHDALAALFPGGSITGAPKLRAMECIAALEGEGRGFFTGSLGFLDLRGRARFNILIRTLVWRPRPHTSGEHGAGEVSFHVGGGITWRSDPAAEVAETLAKGAALAAALSRADEPADTLGLDLAFGRAVRPAEPD